MTDLDHLIKSTRKICDAVETMQADRRTLQATGEHPAPCARHCEAQAYRIEIRRLNAELGKMRIAILSKRGRR